MLTETVIKLYIRKKMSSSIKRQQTEDIALTTFTKLSNLQCQVNPNHSGYDYICSKTSSNCNKLICIDCCKDNLDHITSHGKHFKRLKDFIENCNKDPKGILALDSQNKTPLSKAGPKKIAKSNKATNDDYGDSIPIQNFLKVKGIEDRLEKMILTFSEYTQQESSYMLSY